MQVHSLEGSHSPTVPTAESSTKTSLVCLGRGRSRLSLTNISQPASVPTTSLGVPWGPSRCALLCQPHTLASELLPCFVKNTIWGPKWVPVKNLLALSKQHRGVRRRKKHWTSPGSGWFPVKHIHLPSGLVFGRPARHF